MAIRSIAYKAQMSLHPRAIWWGIRKRVAPDGPLVAKLWGHEKLRVRPRDVIGKSLYVRGVFEPHLTRFLRAFLQPGMRVFDAGTNLGYYSVIAATAVGPSGSVHCFEPNVRMVEEIRENLNLNGLSSRCVVNHVAVSDHEGTAKFPRYAPGFEVYGTLGKPHFNTPEIAGYDEVRLITLDNYVASQRIDRLNLIKIDVEGAELPLLKGAIETLRRFSPVLTVEMADTNTAGFDYSAAEIWEFLSGLGYSFYSPDRAGKPVAISRPASPFDIDVIAMPRRP